MRAAKPVPPAFTRGGGSPRQSPQPPAHFLSMGVKGRASLSPLFRAPISRLKSEKSGAGQRAVLPQAQHRQNGDGKPAGRKRANLFLPLANRTEFNKVRKKAAPPVQRGRGRGAGGSQ